MHTDRMTAEMDAPFVVFVIGMRINRYWKVHRWLPVFLAMPRMLRELESRQDAGLLGYETLWNRRSVVTIQYWKSFEELRGYARDADAEHVPAWVDYAESVGSSGDVGIFHETYLVDPGDCESVYRNLPAFGLGAAGDLAPATGPRETAGQRLGVADDAPAVEEG